MYLLVVCIQSLSIAHFPELSICLWFSSSIYFILTTFTFLCVACCLNMLRQGSCWTLPIAYLFFKSWNRFLFLSFSPYCKGYLPIKNVTVPPQVIFTSHKTTCCANKLLITLINCSRTVDCNSVNVIFMIGSCVKIAMKPDHVAFSIAIFLTSNSLILTSNDLPSRRTKTMKKQLALLKKPLHDFSMSLI